MRAKERVIRKPEGEAWEEEEEESQNDDGERGLLRKVIGGKSQIWLRQKPSEKGNIGKPGEKSMEGSQEESHSRGHSGTKTRDS